MNDGKVVIDVDLNTKTFDSQYTQLEQQLKKDKQRLNNLMKLQSKGVFQGDMTPEIVKLQSNIEKTSNKMIDLRQRMKDVANESRNTGNVTSSNFQKMSNIIKKLGLSLIGLRSAYSLVSRASSAYLSVDTELANKLQSVWVGLGAFLVPLLDTISNALLKALGYLNVFVKALTGIDFLARANAKALNNQAKATSSAAKAQKELNRQQYDFDVIRTQQDNSSSSSGSGGVGGAGFDGLFDIPELDERVVKKLQDLAKWLKENWYWIKKVGEVLLITFGAVKIGQILKNLASLLGGAGSGLIGLQSILTGLATIGVITLGVYLLYTALTGRDLIEDLTNIKKGLDELKKSTEANTKASEKYNEQLKTMSERVQEAIDTGKMSPELLKTTTDFLKNNTTAIGEQIKNLEQQGIRTKEMQEQEKELAKQMETNIGIYELLYKQGLLNEKETDDYKNAILQLIAQKKILGQETDDLEEKYNNLERQTSNTKDETNELKDSEQEVYNKSKDLTGKNWNVNFDTNSDTIEGKISSLIKKVNDFIGSPKSIQFVTDIATGGISSTYRNIKSALGFANGGIVTQPTRALIGEAGYPEAVVPMTQDYLSTLASEIVRAGGAGNSGNNVNNIYLDGRLIDRQVTNRRNQRNFLTNGR